MSNNNQCQGCQAGWPIEEHKPWPKNSKPMKFHLVVGGYKGEKSFCTRKEYESKGGKNAQISYRPNHIALEQTA